MQLKKSSYEVLSDHDIDDSIFLMIDQHLYDVTVLHLSHDLSQLSYEIYLFS